MPPNPSRHRNRDRARPHQKDATHQRERRRSDANRDLSPPPPPLNASHHHSSPTSSPRRRHDQLPSPIPPPPPPPPPHVGTTRHTNSARHHQSNTSSTNDTNPLSAGSLAKLNAINQKHRRKEELEYQRRAARKGKKHKKPPSRLMMAPVRPNEDGGDDGDEDEWDGYREKGSLEKLVGEHGQTRGGAGRDKRRKAERKERSREKEREDAKRRRKKYQKGQYRRDSRRVVSGPLLEEGRNEYWEYRLNEKGAGGGGGGYGGGNSRSRKGWSRRRKIWLLIAVLVIVLAIAIPVGVVTSQNENDNADSDGVVGAAAEVEKPSNKELASISESDIPEAARGSLLDPFAWYDTADFNVTYTEETVGGLSIMGLNSTWDDDVQCNENVPPLNKPFKYGKQPYRGVNIGGWLNVEPFITPSFFEEFNSRDGVIDEWTLTETLGPVKSAQTLERHYSSFVNAQTFAEIRAAGFDHVRFPYGYWMVATYDGDPYVPRLAWRYLLRAIEWCRQNGLRVKLDMHGAPGSQNGWNHSGKQGYIGWLNGTDGALNAQRTLEIHEQLSAFFAQRRYENVVTMYGLVNEPRMVELDTDKVLAWTREAIELIRANGVTAVLVFGDGFMGLDKWQGELQDVDDRLVLDVHQYVIFNVDQLALEHDDKINFACKGWTAQTLRSQNTATGFGPTMCGEWSQADTDCVPHLNNVGVGSRWEGTLNTGNASTQVLSPVCPTNNDPECECNPANAPASEYSDAYKLWLLTFAQAQMESFEKGWGWFYWTWDTENAVQWSYKKGLAAGILPEKTYDRSWKCDDGIPDFQEMGLPEYY